MDDILRRLHTVETTVSDIRTDVSALTAAIPHLATKADVAAVKGSLEANIAELKGGLEADIAEVKGSLEADIAELKGSLEADLAELKGSLEAGMAEVKGSLDTDIAGVKGSIAHLESSLIKWIVGTTLAVATLAFAIARFVAPAGV